MMWYGMVWYGEVCSRYGIWYDMLCYSVVVWYCFGMVIVDILRIVLHSGHTNSIGCLQHSPTATAFISCSDDNRARFWYSEGI